MTTALSELQLIQIIGPTARPTAGSAMRSRQDNIIKSVVASINIFGPLYGLDKYTNLSRFIGQVAVECDYFRTTKEYASGAAYEGRKDLGNVISGDGTRFRGRGIIQVTGRFNYSKFNEWAKKSLAIITKEPVPDFLANPEKLELFPWAFFSAIWFWSEGNRTGKSLNIYASQGNDEMITRVINGGLTHYDRRLEMTKNAGLVLLGYRTDTAGIKQFQADNKLVADGLFGAKSRVALNLALATNDLTHMIDEAKLVEDIGPPDPIEEPVAPKPSPPGNPGKKSMSTPGLY